MNERRQQLENIIVGSLASAFDEYWEDVCCCVTADMMQDERNRRTFAKAAELHRQGKKVDLSSLTDRGRSEDTHWIVELATEKTFDYLQWDYNFRQHYGLPTTDVTFEKYVTTYLQYAQQ